MNFEPSNDNYRKGHKKHENTYRFNVSKFFYKYNNISYFDKYLYQYLNIYLAI